MNHRFIMPAESFQKLFELMVSNGKELKKCPKEYSKTSIHFIQRSDFTSFHKHDFEIMKLGNRGAERRNY